jgi:putative ABC transport system permease protein
MTLIGFMGKNLFRRRLRTALTIMAITIAFLIFGLLLSAQTAIVSGGSTLQADRLITTNKINFTLTMPRAYVERVRGLKGVKHVSFANWFGGYFQEPREQVVTFAVDAEPYLAMYPEYVFDPTERQAFLQDRGSVAVGEAYASVYGWKVGDRIPLSSDIFSQKNGGSVWDVSIAAIARGSEPKIDTHFILLHYDYFNETQSFDKDRVGWLILQTEDPKLNDGIIARIDGMFANSAFETETKTEQAFNAAFAAQLGDIAFMVTAVVGAAFVTILLIAGNTMMLAVRERSGEIAILKTIGFTSARIFRLVLGESLLLACLGGLFGLGLCWLITAAVGGSIPQFPPVVLAPGTVLLGLAIMLALGFVTGLIPALRAVRTGVTTALGRA